MQKAIITFLFSFLLSQTPVQAQKKVSTYLLAQYNRTLYDATIGNNPSGAGLGFQTFFNNKSKFKPTLEVTGDIYLEDNKVLKVTPNHEPMEDVRAMVNFFAGSSFQPTQNIYLSFLAGPSFIHGKTFFGIKPSVDFFFCKNQKWMGKISYINIFNRTQQAKEDFGSVSFAVGIKLF